MYNKVCSYCGKRFTALNEDELLCGECRKMQNARVEQQKQMDSNPAEEIGIDGEGSINLKTPTAMNLMNRKDEINLQRECGLLFML